MNQDLLESAFELAYFLHGDRETALAVASGAALKVEVAAAAQDKRLYYRPKRQSPRGGSKAGFFRTKVSWSDAHLLQRMVLIESEIYERAREEAAPNSLTQEEMTGRFVKQLIQITMRRNSFYAMLGVARVLHAYPTSDAMAMYDALFPDAEHLKQEDYFRSRKAVLMQELRKRFGHLLRTVHGLRGEERFETRPADRITAALVGECLDRFTPWGSKCSGWPGDDSGRGGSPPDEHALEAGRFHAFLHPPCFQKLTRSLRLDDPERHLEIPRFALSGIGEDRGGPGKGRDLVPLSSDELAAIEADLAREAERRRPSAAGLLRVLVDGAETACLDPEESRSVRFDVPESAELLEVRRAGGQPALLATLLFTDVERIRQERRAAHSITLEGGQRFSFRLSRESEGEAGVPIVVEFLYEETEPIRAFSLALRRLIRRVRNFLASSGRVTRPAWLLTFLAAIAIGILIYATRPESPAPRVASGRPLLLTPRVETAPRATTPAAAGGEIPAPAPVVPPPAREPARVGPEIRPERSSEGRLAGSLPSRPIPREEPEEGGETRALTTPFADIGLAGVRRVAVEPAGEDDRETLIRKELALVLGSSGRIATVEARKGADAVLRVSVRPAGQTGQFVVAAELINPRGKVIWPLEGRRRVFRLRENASELAGEIAGALLEDIRRAK